jgi:hypothetical protein
MKILLAIDDTDDLESRGTGHLAEDIAQEVERNGWGRRSYITRHQLLVHPDVPYTSHNSAMCFTADVDPMCLDRLVALAATTLERERAPGSDPGLCVAVADRLASHDEAIAWGRAAKTTVLRKPDAYALAQRLGVHLSEHGGTGQGVIGALAGVGLRLSGCDGRVRGHLDIPNSDGTASVRQIRAHPHVQRVVSLDGSHVGDEDRVVLGEKVKAVMRDGGLAVLVVPAGPERPDARWQTCPKELLKAY